MKSLIVITVIAAGALLCHGAPAQEIIAVAPAAELSLQPLDNSQFNMGRVLDRTLSTITLADCVNFLSDSVNKNVKPFVDGWGKFSLRSLHEIITNMKHNGEALVSNVHEIVQGAKEKKEEIISSVQDKGEELLAKKKTVLSHIQNTGEQLIEGVVDGAKKKISVITHPNQKPYHDDSGLAFTRRKRQVSPAVEEEVKADQVVGSKDPLETEGRIDALNEVDTKIANDLDDVYPSYLKPSSSNWPKEHGTVALVVPEPIPEYYTLGELTDMFVKWIRKSLPLQRLWRRPSVTSARK